MSVIGSPVTVEDKGADDQWGLPATGFKPRGRDGSAWDIETVVDAVSHAESELSLALDGAGNALVSYRDSCSGTLLLARQTISDAVLYRGEVTTLSTGWKATALPLTEANDFEAWPFPFATRVGLSAEDSIATTAPLTLYRLLLDGTNEAGNVLRTVKIPGLVVIRY